MTKPTQQHYCRVQKEVCTMELTSFSDVLRRHSGFLRPFIPTRLPAVIQITHFPSPGDGLGSAMYAAGREHVKMASRLSRAPAFVPL